MATDLDKLLEELQYLTREQKRRLREALDEKLAGGEPQIRTADRLQALSALREELAALPVRNPSDGFSNRDHDKLVGGG